MTLRDWLDHRAPAAPPALQARMAEALGARAAAPEDAAPQLFVDAAAEVLMALLRREPAGREDALDLLAADALVTYAFEAAGSDPVALGDRANAAMARIAALASVLAAPNSTTEASAGARVDARE